MQSRFRYSTPAQTTEKPKDTEPSALGTPVPANIDKNPQDKNAGTSNDRLFFTLPNFLTLENAGQAPPLTTKQKYKVVARSPFDFTLPNTLSVWGTQVGYDTIALVVKEFWPHAHRKLTHKKADGAPPGN